MSAAPRLPDPRAFLRSLYAAAVQRAKRAASRSGGTSAWPNAAGEYHTMPARSAAAASSATASARPSLSSRARRRRRAM